MKTRTQVRKRKFYSYLSVFGLTMLATVITLMLSGDWSRYYKLNKEFAVANGWVVGRFAKFSVKDKKFETTLPIGYIYSRISAEVKYFPPNPQIACVCNPSESLEQENWFMMLEGLVVSLFVLWGYHHFRKDYWD